MKKLAEPDLLAERPSLDWSKAVRGKYSNLFKQGTNVAILDPALLPHFPDSQSVNAALHAFLTLPAEARAAAFQQSTAKPHPAAEDFDPRTGTLQKCASLEASRIRSV